MTEIIKPIDLLTVADFQVHPVWEFSNDDVFDETAVRPVEEIPVESLDERIVGAQVRLANGLAKWAIIGGFDVKNPRATQHFLGLSIEHGGTWFRLARYFDVGFSTHNPEALARFLGLHVDDIFPITVDVRRYVRGDPGLLTAVVLKEPKERLTREERRAFR